MTQQEFENLQFGDKLYRRKDVYIFVSFDHSGTHDDFYAVSKSSPLSEPYLMLHDTISEFSLTPVKNMVRREVPTVAYINHCDDNIALEFDNDMWNDILKANKENLPVVVTYEVEEK